MAVCPKEKGEVLGVCCPNREGAEVATAPNGEAVCPMVCPVLDPKRGVPVDGLVAPNAGAAAGVPPKLNEGAVA